MESHEERISRLSNYKLQAPHIAKAHPRPEHLMPAMVAAGAAYIAPEDEAVIKFDRVCKGRLMHTSWVRDSVSLAGYLFESTDSSFEGLFVKDILVEDDAT